MRDPLPSMAARLLALLVTSAILTPGSAAQDGTAADARQLARQVQEAVAQLDALRSAAAAAQTAHREEVDALERQIERLERTAADSRRLAEEEAAEGEELQRVTVEAQAHRDALRQRAQAWVHALRVPLSRMAERVAAGIGWRREDRAARVEELCRRLESDDILEQLEAVSQVPAWTAEELNAARRVELANEPVALEGGTLRSNAWRLRLGLAQLAFLAEDGAKVGVWQRGGGWNLDVDTAHRAALEEALDILREKEPPAVTVLPFPRPRGRKP